MCQALPMTEGQLKVAFYLVTAAACFAGLWFNVEPYVCPVPVALLSQPGTVPCLEFWFSRYQTLLAAVLAIAGVVIGARPVWRQLRLLEIQGFKETYGAISDAVALLQWEEDEATRYSPEGKMPFMDARAVLIEGFYVRRQARLKTLYKALSGVPLDSDARAVVDELVAKIKALVDDYRDRGQASLNITIGEPKSGNISEGWFFYADQFDRMVRVHMREAAQKLDSIRSMMIDRLRYRAP
jgi:hypothetical protein